MKLELRATKNYVETDWYRVVSPSRDFPKIQVGLPGRKKRVRFVVPFPPLLAYWDVLRTPRARLGPARNLTVIFQDGGGDHLKLEQLLFDPLKKCRDNVLHTYAFVPLPLCFFGVIDWIRRRLGFGESVPRSVWVWPVRGLREVGSISVTMCLFWLGISTSWLTVFFFVWVVSFWFVRLCM